MAVWFHICLIYTANSKIKASGSPAKNTHCPFPAANRLTEHYRFISTNKAQFNFVITDATTQCYKPAKQLKKKITVGNSLPSHKDFEAEFSIINEEQLRTRSNHRYSDRKSRHALTTKRSRLLTFFLATPLLELLPAQPPYHPSQPRPLKHHFSQASSTKPFQKPQLPPLRPPRCSKLHASPTLSSPPPLLTSWAQKM